MALGHCNRSAGRVYIRDFLGCARCRLYGSRCAGKSVSAARLAGATACHVQYYLYRNHTREFFVCWRFTFFSDVDMPISDVLGLVMLPGVLLNMLLAIPVYAVMRDLARWVYPVPEVE